MRGKRISPILLRYNQTMKRHHIYAVVLTVASLLWLWAKSFQRTMADPRVARLIDVAPWYMLVCFGSYCLGKLGIDLLTFNNYPAEIGKLERVCTLCCSELFSDF